MYLILRFVLGIIIQYYYGRLAQLVEHLLDVQRVSGSIPLASTKQRSERNSRQGMGSDLLFFQKVCNDLAQSGISPPDLLSKQARFSFKKLCYKTMDEKSAALFIQLFSVLPIVL